MAHGSALILLVEDHEDSAEMMTLFLETEGYRVRAVGTAQEALAAIEEGGIDLVLLDLTLPDLDGLELAYRIKQRLQEPPPIVIMSAKSEQAVESAAQDIAAAGFVRKPFATDRLVQSIERALGH